MATLKEELPKINESLKNELISEHHLKPTTTEEKNNLPTVEAIVSEKNEKELREEIEHFDTKTQLKEVTTCEKIVLPTLDQIQQEKCEISQM